jgi:hypothetical protein
MNVSFDLRFLNGSVFLNLIQIFSNGLSSPLAARFI